MQLSIVSYLDNDATKAVRDLQKSLSEVTGSKASLSSWSPHVTLGDGVRTSGDELINFINELKSVTSTIPSFELSIAGFGSLDSRPLGEGEVSTPHLIYIKVKVNEQLKYLVDNIANITKSYPKWYHMPEPYLPHVTLAFRDLSSEGYDAGLDYIKNKSVNVTSQINHTALVQKLEETDEEYLRIELKSSKLVH